MIALALALTVCLNQDSPVDPSTWEVRDREARWVLLEQDVARSGLTHLNAHRF